MLSTLSLSFSPPSMLSVPAVRYRSNSAPAKPSPPSRPGFIRGYCSSKETDLRRYALNRHWVEKARGVYRQVRVQSDDESSSTAPHVPQLSDDNSDRAPISIPISAKPTRPSLKRTESMTLCLAPPSPASASASPSMPGISSISSIRPLCTQTTAANRPTRPILRCTVTVTLTPPSSSPSSFPALTASRPSIARTASIFDLPTLLSPSCVRARASLDSALSLSDPDLVAMQRQLHHMYSLVLICLFLLLVRLVHALVPGLGFKPQ
ncbi:hypothetical protein K438DRAFT_1822108 [Mycena galopus ATCC 62051]|nr:hypothetical protein K438DRAFT_1822108 [Mycena galopus ATCC 62051]